MSYLRALCLAACSFSLYAADAWPTYMGDNQRSGGSNVSASLTANAVWEHQREKPSIGFYTPEINDTNGPQRVRNPTTTNDLAYAPIIVDDHVFFGTSTEEALFCLDATNGAERWRFYTEGAIRFAPVWDNGKVYIGSDDGRVYCVDASTGTELWRAEASPEQRRIIAHGRVSSQWPLRTGLALHDGKIYFSAGLFPSNGGVYLSCLHADTGKEVWRESIEFPSQGYIYVDDDRLIVPNGRTNPSEYDLATGKNLVERNDKRREGGSAFVGKVGDYMYYGPNEFGVLRFRVEKKKIDDWRIVSRSLNGIFTGITGWRLVDDESNAYFLRGDILMAMPLEHMHTVLKKSAKDMQNTKAIKKDRKRVAFKSGVQLQGDAQADKELIDGALWQIPVHNGRSLIRVGSDLIVGAQDHVYVISSNGTLSHDYPVNGLVWELASCNGMIVASTDTGHIYSFGEQALASAPAVQPENPFARPSPSHQTFAKKIMAASETDKGFCMILGAGNGRLAYEIAQASQLSVICIEANLNKANTARKHLVDAGVYGSRVTVHHIPDETLPYTSYMANVLVINKDAFIPWAPADIRAIQRPYGGIIVCNGETPAWGADFGEWTTDDDISVNIRTDLPGAGRWTHMFADAANTSCSNDDLVQGQNYRMQWFGHADGNKAIVGWHANGMGPLSIDGLLVMLKANYVTVVDAYNGTKRWEKSIPKSARFSPSREGGSACLDEQHFYIATENNCQVYDIKTGALLHTWLGPETYADKEWGFIAVHDTHLFGTKQIPNASVNLTSSGYRADKSKDGRARDTKRLFRRTWNASEPEHAISETLFAHNITDGSLAWSYGDNSQRIINTSITVGDDGAIYFIETRNPDCIADEDGSIDLRDAYQDAYLIALNTETGAQLYTQKFVSQTRTISYLSWRDGTLIFTAGYHTGAMADAGNFVEAASKIAKRLKLSRKDIQETCMTYAFTAFEASTGKQLWQSSYHSDGYVGNQHNYNIGHPVITPTTIWHNPGEQYLVYADIKTGTITERKDVSRGKGCSTPTGSLHNLFYRSLAVASYDTIGDKQFYISQVSRPSCWMNILPTSGLVLLPEYSLGCNCAFPLQTSFALLPVP